MHIEYAITLCITIIITAESEMIARYSVEKLARWHGMVWYSTGVTYVVSRDSQWIHMTLIPKTTIQPNCDSSENIIIYIFTG